MQKCGSRKACERTLAMFLSPKRVAATIVILTLTSCYLFFPIEYGTPENIFVPNSSFESPGGITDNGLLNVVDDWTPGGNWYGKFQSSVVPDGEYAIWSSYSHDGIIPDNGWSQELSTVFAEGKYTLSVITMADNTDGLVSGLYLGYDAGDDTYKELAYEDVLITYDPNVSGFSYSDWITLTIVYEVRSTNRGLGKPIWIRMSTRSSPTGEGGGSCWWDDVTLTVSYPLE